MASFDDAASSLAHNDSTLGYANIYKRCTYKRHLLPQQSVVAECPSAHPLSGAGTAKTLQASAYSHQHHYSKIDIDRCVSRSTAHHTRFQDSNRPTISSTSHTRHFYIRIIRSTRVSSCTVLEEYTRNYAVLKGLSRALRTLSSCRFCFQGIESVCVPVEPKRVTSGDWPTDATLFIHGQRSLDVAHKTAIGQ